MSVAVPSAAPELAVKAFLTGVQALARLPLLQSISDRAAGLNTRGFVSGYRGSPLGGLDSALHASESALAAHGVRFHPGINEDLAATAIWGTQQLHLLPEPQCDGIFSMWYGKGPGVDRSADVFKHANHAGTSRHGGVLVVAGDDHAARSSAVAHQSEHLFSASAIPVLAPAGVQEILDFGLHGWAMSRFSGCWVALKLPSDIVESSASVVVDPDRVHPNLPADFKLPVDGVHIRWPDPAPVQEQRMMAHKVYAAAAYARANGLDRLVVDSAAARLGVLACGKAWLDLRQAMVDLGIDDMRAQALGLRVYKVGMPWPLEADGARRFATGLDEILVVEEKRPIIEYQLKEMLYDWRDDVRPHVVGKFDERGEWPAPSGQWLLPPTGELTPLLVARALASRLARIDRAGDWMARAAALIPLPPSNAIAPAQRTPYFCSGCPHNQSTRVPDGSCALGGVGCHLMAVWMERRTLTISQMGGEGVTWVGMAAHSGLRHVFANMGDGTYHHSGLLAIRAAVAADVNITYKLLFNDAVAMTGGQPIDGPLSVPQLTRQLAAEGVTRIIVVADDPKKYPRRSGFAQGVEVHPREQLDALQRELREVKGVSALIYDQTCATEARRRRKRRLMPAADRHVFINEALCEGCGDCGLKSNCLSVVPVETEFGSKRAIDPFTCNFDLTCLTGCCPALVTVERATVKRGVALHAGPEDAFPEPDLPALDTPYSILIAGIGGTGVVTVGALLGLAAHLEGKGVTVLDQTGLSQKGGAVLTHVRIAAAQDELYAPRIAHADVLLGCDLLVTGSAETVSRVRRDRTRAVINTASAITGEFLRHPELDVDTDVHLKTLREAVQTADLFNASALAATLAGHSIATNVFLLGFAWQRGLIPIGRAALMQAMTIHGVAIEDNRCAFAWGRRAALDPAGVQALAQGAHPIPAARRLSTGVDEAIERRRADLVAYQDEALALRFDRLLARVRVAEHSVAPQSVALVNAVARQMHRLLAVKDEYEVARRFCDPAFDAALRAQFDGDIRWRMHVAPPWQRASDSPRKWSLGPWIKPLLHLLASLRGARGRWFDPFGRTAEHRAARALAHWYETIIDRLLSGLTASNLDQAVRIASAPSSVSGYGVVRQRTLEPMRARVSTLLKAYTPLSKAAP